MNEGKVKMRHYVCGSFGVIGSVIASFWGGLSASMQLLLLCIICDYVSGLVCAGVFHKSNKSKSGALESNASLKGLCRKGMILFVVLIGHYLDKALGSQYIAPAICYSFCANELLSIVENLGLMGVPYPQIIKNAIELLNTKGDNKDKEEDKKN